jgi:hypothetical protein
VQANAAVSAVIAGAAQTVQTPDASDLVFATL